MPPRSSWKGFIRLSLVSVPVKAYTANQTSEDIRLNQLHADCHQRIRYRKVCPEHGEVQNDAIVSGYEFAKDQYVVIDPEEIEKIRKTSDRSIAIEGFVETGEVDPVYLSGRTYYLLPDGVAGRRPYALLARGMEDEGVVALARVVLSKREQLVLLRSIDGLLAMSFLHHAAKVKPQDDFRDEIDESAVPKEELKLTETLIAASKIEDFDLAAFKDGYVEDLKRLIELKLEGEEVVQVAEPEEPKIVNLMEALKQSVAAAKAAERKMAPSVKGKKAAAKKKAPKRKTG
jgi:DNA end-binding protein Ku